MNYLNILRNPKKILKNTKKYQYIPKNIKKYTKIPNNNTLKISKHYKYQNNKNTKTLKIQIS